MTEEHGPDIVKWYTRARKFPQLIGRTPDGANLPGGPYTITQAVAAGVILFVGLNTMSLWARFGFIGNIVLLTAVTVVVVWTLGRIPVGSRSPVSVVSGLARAFAAPTNGRLAGRAVRIPRPRQLRHRVVFAVDQHLEPASATGPAEAIPLIRARADIGTAPRTSSEIHLPCPPLPSAPAQPRVQIACPETTPATPQTPAEPLVAVEAPDPPPTSVLGQRQPARPPLAGVQALLANRTGTSTGTGTAAPTTLPEETDR